MKLKARAKQLKTDIPAVFFAMKHKDTPWYAKVVAAVTVCYALSPIDLIPDFIPILGYLDDIILLPLLILLVIKLIPGQTLELCREQADKLLKSDNRKPKQWYFAIPIILIWCGICLLVIFAIF